MNAGHPPTPAVRLPAQSQPTTAFALPLRELSQYLADLHDALKRLGALAAEKLAALRTANTAALRDCAVRENELVRQVLCDEQQRDAVLARLAQSLPGCPPKPVRLTELIEHLPEPLAGPLRARRAGLQEMATELQRKNRLVEAVVRNLQAHIRGVFAEVAKAAQESLVYGARGQHEVGSTRCCMDAVG
jgi:flagellar biosynthesis/type III secretory pathway chaperone